MRARLVFILASIIVGASIVVLGPASPAAAVPPGPCVGPQTVLAADFSTDPGGFTATRSQGPVSAAWTHTGSAWFGNGVGEVSQIELTSPTVTLPHLGEFGEYYLSFDHSYLLETSFDGGQVQYSVNGGPFATVQDSSFTQNAYDLVISTNFDNPISGQRAFTGLQNTQRTSIVDLTGIAEAGDQIAVRFRVATDSSIASPGWTINSVMFGGCANALAPSITSAATDTAPVQSAYSHTFEAIGTPGPTLTYTNLNLPAGLALTGDTLSGTPTQTGTFGLTATATNGVGTPAVQNFTLEIVEAPVITSDDTLTIVIGESVAHTFEATGTPAPVLTFDDVTLPDGVTLAAGVLSGTPTETGTFGLTVTAENGVGDPVVQTFSLIVSAPAEDSTGSEDPGVGDVPVPIGGEGSASPPTTGGLLPAGGADAGIGWLVAAALMIAAGASALIVGRVGARRR